MALGFIADVWSFAQRAAPIVEAAAKVGQSVVTYLAAEQQKQLAERNQQLREDEILRERMLRESAARKEARIREAQLVVQQGGVAKTSTTSFGVIGLRSSLDSGLQDLSERTAFNLESSRIGTQNAVNEATALQIGAGLTAAAESVSLGGEFSDLLDGDEPDLFDLPSGSFENRG